MNTNRDSRGRYNGRARYGNKAGLADWLASNERRTAARSQRTQYFALLAAFALLR